MEVDNKRLVVAFILVFALGVLFALVNGFYAAEAGEQLPLIVYAVSFVSVLLGAGIVLLFQWRLTRHQIRQLLQVLPREERMIVKALLDNDGKLEQNKLVALTGLSKVKVSRTTDRLRERDVLSKHPLGNTNLVSLEL